MLRKFNWKTWFLMKIVVGVVDVWGKLWKFLCREGGEARETENLRKRGERRK